MADRIADDEAERDGFDPLTDLFFGMGAICLLAVLMILPSVGVAAVQERARLKSLAEVLALASTGSTVRPPMRSWPARTGSRWSIPRRPGAARRPSSGSARMPSPTMPVSPTGSPGPVGRGGPSSS